MITMYYVDLFNSHTEEMEFTILKTTNCDEAHKAARQYNYTNDGIAYYAEVIEIEEGEDEMKKYTLKDYKQFCDEVLVAPPVEEFEDGTSDEDDWYEQHKIYISVGDNSIELDYYADNVNEISYALREMYEVEYENSYATTGNTVGNEYRPAELKDLVKVAVREGWEHYGYKMRDFGSYIRCFIDEHENLEDIMHCYKYIKDIEEYTEEYKCNFGKLDMYSMCNVSSETIKNIISELICTERELLFGITEDDKTSDIVFVMDYSLKPAGELVGWFYGQDNIDEEYIDNLIEDYKKKLFGEEN